MAERGARPEVHPIRRMMLRAVRHLFTPLRPDDYLEMINPLWTTRELRGRVERVDPAGEAAATVVIRPSFEWAGHRAGLKVSLCGELAANPLATPILLGLGLDEFSLSPIYLPEVKQVIRASPLDAATDLAQRCLLAPDAASVRRMAAEFLAEVLPSREGLDAGPDEGLDGAGNGSAPASGTSAAPDGH